MSDMVMISQFFFLSAKSVPADFGIIMQDIFFRHQYTGTNGIIGKLNHSSF